MKFEVLPEFELGDLSTIELTREVAEVADEEVDDAVERIAEQNRAYEARVEER